MSAIICSQCVMDETDPDISFDENGACNHCTGLISEPSNRLSSEREIKESLDSLILRVKSKGLGKKYDCIAGISGGLDSSYLIYKMKDWGLNPLLVHVDAGWNTPEAVSNIKAVADYTGFDLYTKVVYWPDMRAIQKLIFFQAYRI